MNVYQSHQSGIETANLAMRDFTSVTTNRTKVELKQGHVVLSK